MLQPLKKVWRCSRIAVSERASAEGLGARRLSQGSSTIKQHMEQMDKAGILRGAEGFRARLPPEIEDWRMDCECLAPYSPGHSCGIWHKRVSARPRTPPSTAHP